MNNNQSGPILNSEEGVQRRTIVAGAAWTIPVIAAATAAPLAAASAAGPDLVITNFTNAPQAGYAPVFSTPDGGPGYYQYTPLFTRVDVTNGSGSAATGFTLNVQIPAQSYLNGTASVNSASTPGWTIAQVYPDGGGNAIVQLVWTGSLPAGETARLFLNYQVNENPSTAGWVLIGLVTGLGGVTPAETNTGNNTAAGYPNYWVRTI